MVSGCRWLQLDGLAAGLFRLIQPVGSDEIKGEPVVPVCLQRLVSEGSTRERNGLLFPVFLCVLVRIGKRRLSATDTPDRPYYRMIIASAEHLLGSATCAALAYTCGWHVITITG